MIARFADPEPRGRRSSRISTFDVIRVENTIPLFVLSLDIFSRVILHHRRGDQGQDRADENVDSDRIGGVIFYEQPSCDQAAWRPMRVRLWYLTNVPSSSRMSA